MFTVETFGDRKVSFEKNGLSLSIDIWGDAEWIFTAAFGAEAYYLWKVYQAKPMGEPTRSRMNTSFGIGETAEHPTTIKADFLCQEDMDDFEKQVRKALKKKGTYQSYTQMRKEAEKQEAEEKKQRKAALNK